ncbi:MAG: phosphotransferase [Proteobacteria bacterium]|nr:phosphotransferase [Pseudomonadota bacterium]
MTAPLPPAAGPERPSLPGVPPASTPAAPVAWADPARADAFARWIEAIAPAQGLRPDTVRLASADASFRRYLRVDTATPGLARIVMDAPPDKEDSRPFVKVAALMREAGVTAPEVLAWDEPQGFMLLDDLGRQTMLDRIDRDHAETNRPRYEQAIEALIRWQLASRPGVLPPYDAALLQRELQLFPDWYLAKHRGVAVEGKLKETLDKTFALIVEQNLRAAPVYVHRDFMPRNLMVNGDALGVLDFQDAVYGPITYDIASLMRDAFLTWEEDFVIDITVRYWQAARKAGLPVDEDFGDFYRAVEWMGLQRHLKVAGIFARLTLRDGKPKYLADTPRFIGYIRATASRYRELTPLLRLIDQVEGTEAATGYAFGRL